MPRRRPLAHLAAVLCLAGSGASCAEIAAQRAQVSLARPVTLGELPGVDAAWLTEARAFFRAVYTVQVTIFESERVRLTALGRLSALLALPSSDSTEALAEALRVRARSEKEQGRRFQVHLEPGLPPQPGSDGLPAAQLVEEAHTEVFVVLRPWGSTDDSDSQPLDDRHCESAEGRLQGQHRRSALDRQLLGASDEIVLAGMCLSLRSLSALEHRLQLVALAAPGLRDRGRRLALALSRVEPSRRAALEREFTAAVDQLDAAPAEAEAQTSLAHAASERMRLAVDVIDDG